MSKNELDDLQKRRAEEFRQYQIRLLITDTNFSDLLGAAQTQIIQYTFFNMWHVSLRTGKENDVLILAPANTPLQYPMRGFRVTPLNKTPIPGESDFSQSFI